MDHRIYLFPVFLSVNRAVLSFIVKTCFQSSSRTITPSANLQQAASVQSLW